MNKEIAVELAAERERLDQLDRKAAALLVERMQIVERVAALKEQAGMPVYDPTREAEMLSRCGEACADEAVAPYWQALLSHAIELSRAYQEQRRRSAQGEQVFVPMGRSGYPVTLLRGGLAHIAEIFSLQTDVLVLTDDGVPSAYAKAVARACRRSVILTLPAGEASKSVDNWMRILRTLSEKSIDRLGAVVTVGGGMVSDIGGFAASCFLRGIPCWNVPTTLLAMVDASVGGKTGLDMDGVKNRIGSFAPPAGVLIDPSLLCTLPRRQLASGMAEVVKAGLIGDQTLFEQCEAIGRLNELWDDPSLLDELIRRALEVKLAVVRIDPYERSMRRILNFGHTLGHGIEAAEQGTLLHGECVALGMLPLCAPDIRARLKRVLTRLKLPVTYVGEPTAIVAAMRQDKKAIGKRLCCVRVDEIGNPQLIDTTADRLLSEAMPIWKGE